MKRFSEPLEELSTRVAALEDSATAAYVEDRAALEQRRKEIDAAFNIGVDEFELGHPRGGRRRPELVERGQVLDRPAVRPTA